MKIDLQDYSLPYWITKNDIKTEDGSLYSFKDHLFFFDILVDMASLEKDIVCFKAAQIGFSTAAILATLWIAMKRQIDIIYTLPTMDDVRQFAGGKINRIIAQNYILIKWVKDRDTIEQKTVGDSIIYYRGTFAEKAAMMVSSDLNVYDEVDASNQKTIEQYETRLQASKLKRQWYFSHPSIKGNGVDKQWARSDQKHWFVKCSCGEEQFISWPESFDMKNKRYICKYCGAEISDEQRRKGRWVKKYKNAELSGYWIPLWICPWITAEEIISYFEKKSPEYFTNKVCGLPYLGSDCKVRQDDILGNLTSEVNSQDRIIIGSDSGIRKHYVMGNKEGLFYYGVTEDWGEIGGLLGNYKNAVLIVDHLPDITGPRALREKFPGRVFLCHYAEDRKTLQLVRWGKDKEQGNVVVDRNRMFDMLIAEFKERRIQLQGDEGDWWDYWLHWDALYKSEEEDKYGVKKGRWLSSGTNHNSDWCHATNYWRAGMSRFGGGGEGKIIEGKQIEFPESPTISLQKTIKVDSDMLIRRKKKDWRQCR